MAPVNTQVAKAASEVLFSAVKVGAVQLEHRIVMPPLTRCRALGTVPQPNMGIYYGQRATQGGLLIAEATGVNDQSYGYPCTPGIHTQEQIEAWKPIVKAVKDKGGAFFCQLWHCGRASHQDYQPNGALPVSSSATPLAGQCFSPKSFTMVDHPVPRALELPEIQQIVEDFRKSAANARAAGFDGVEIHGANGYLLEQFLRDGINKRTDQYGGSIENRARLVLEVVDACCAEIGSDRVGIRLSPFSTFLGSDDSHRYTTYMYMIEELNKRNLAYVHLVQDRLDSDMPSTLAPFRAVYKGTVILAGNLDQATAAEAVASGAADLVAFGRHFVSTPDLVARVKLGKPFNKYDRDTFYTQDNKGYIDYPTLSE